MRLKLFGRDEYSKVSERKAEQTKRESCYLSSVSAIAGLHWRNQSAYGEHRSEMVLSALQGRSFTHASHLLPTAPLKRAERGALANGPDRRPGPGSALSGAGLLMAAGHTHR